MLLNVLETLSGICLRSAYFGSLNGVIELKILFLFELLKRLILHKRGYGFTCKIVGLRSVEILFIFQGLGGVVLKLGIMVEFIG